MRGLLFGGVALVAWLAVAPFWWWSQQRAPRKAGFAKTYILEESFPQLTADGRFAVSAKLSKTRFPMSDGIIIREVPTGKIYWQFNIGPFKYSNIEFSPDGKFLVVLTHDLKARHFEAHVFDIAERRQVGKCKLDPVPLGLTVSPGGTTLAGVDLSGEEKHVILYDVQTGERKVLPHSAFDLRFSPDGSRLAFWDEKSISIIDLRTEKELPSFALPSSIQRIIFSPDGQTIFAFHKDGTLRAWDIRTRSDRVLFQRQSSWHWIRVAANGKALAIHDDIPVEGNQSKWEETIILDSETGRRLATFQKCWDVAFGSDGKTLVTAHVGREVYLDLWDIPPRGRLHWGWTVLLAAVATGLTMAWWWIRRTSSGEGRAETRP